METNDKFFFLPPDLRNKCNAQVINPKTGFVQAFFLETRIVFPFSNIFPVEGVQFYITIPEEWFEIMTKQTFPSEWLNFWRSVRGCYFFSKKTTTNIVLSYDKYDFAMSIVEIEIDLPTFKTPFSINFFTKKGVLKEFEEDLLFVSFLKTSLSYLQNNNISYLIIISEGEFLNVYQHILAKLKEKKYAYCKDILRKKDTNLVLFVKDEEMKNRIEYYQRLKLPINKTIFYREEVLEEEINKYEIGKGFTEVKDKNILKTYINTSGDNVQFFNPHGNEIYTVKKFINSEQMKQWLNIHEPTIAQQIYTIDEFLKNKLQKGVIRFENERLTNNLYFFLQKIV